MQAPDIFSITAPHRTRDANTVEVTVSLSHYGKTRLRAGLIALRLASVMLAPFKVDIAIGTYGTGGIVDNPTPARAGRGPLDCY